jgi:hypothetical protein
MDIEQIQNIIDNGLDHLSEGVAKKYQNPEGGLNAKGRAHFKRTQGANLKPPVSKKAAKKSPKKASRRKSFCARMGGQKKMHNVDCRKNPDKDICKALRKWDCNESYKQDLDAIFETKKNSKAAQEQKAAFLNNRTNKFTIPASMTISQGHPTYTSGTGPHGTRNDRPKLKKQWRKEAQSEGDL